MYVCNCHFVNHYVYPTAGVCMHVWDGIRGNENSAHFREMCMLLPSSSAHNFLLPSLHTFGNWREIERSREYLPHHSPPSLSLTSSPSHHLVWSGIPTNNNVKHFQVAGFFFVSIESNSRETKCVHSQRQTSPPKHCSIPGARQTSRKEEEICLNPPSITNFKGMKLTLLPVGTNRIQIN